MALKMNAKIIDGIPVIDAYVRVDTVMLTKDREFVARLASMQDSVLDEIDAVNADTKLMQLAEGAILPDGVVDRDAENIRRASVKVAKLAALNATNDNLTDRLARHPGGACYMVVKIEVRKNSTGKQLPAPELDVFKFKEFRFVQSSESPLGIAMEYRPADTAPVVVVPVPSVDMTACGYALIKSVPAVAALAPEDV